MHSFAPFSKLKFQPKIANIFSRLNIEFLIFSFFSSNSAFFLRIFDEILSGFRDKFQKRVTRVAFSLFFLFFQSNLREKNRNLPKILKSDSVKIIQYYSIFIRVLRQDQDLHARRGVRRHDDLHDARLGRRRGAGHAERHLEGRAHGRELPVRRWVYLCFHELGRNSATLSGKL